MRVWLFLYLESLKGERDLVFRHRGKFHCSLGVLPASRSFITKRFLMVDGAVQNVYRRLNTSGLIKISFDESTNLNIINIPLVQPKGIKYFQLPLSKNIKPFIEVPSLLRTYIYIMFSAAQESCLSCRRTPLKRGEALCKIGEISHQLVVPEKEVKNSITYLKEAGLVDTEKVKNYGLKFTLNEYPSEKVNEQKSNNVAESNYTEEIIQTPLTAAVSTYFFGRKSGIRDIAVLNTVIQELGEKFTKNLPDFNVEKLLPSAMEKYLKEHGSEYPDSNKIFKFICDYYSEMKNKEWNAQQEILKQKEAEKANEKILDNFIKVRFCIWTLLYFKEFGNFPSISHDQLEGVYYFFAPVIGGFLGGNEKSLEKLGDTDIKVRHSSWTNKHRGMALHLEHLFEELDDEQLKVNLLTRFPGVIAFMEKHKLNIQSFSHTLLSA